MTTRIDPQCIYSLALAQMLDAPRCNPTRAAVYVETDAPSGVAMFTVYTDDGAGNGKCLLSLPLAALLSLAADNHALASS